MHMIRPLPPRVRVEERAALIRRPGGAPFPQLRAIRIPGWVLPPWGPHAGSKAAMRGYTADLEVT